MTKDEELSKYLVLIEQYKEQINSLETQYSYLQAAVTDYNKAKITLEQLNKHDQETELLFPIGGGTYLDASAKNTSKVFFDIGAGIVTEKTAEDVINKIDKKLEDLEKTQEKLLTTIQKLQTEATQISGKAQELLAADNK
jgi:prefoldin alpha subunit